MRGQWPQLAVMVPWCLDATTGTRHHAAALLVRGHNARMPACELRPAVAGDHPPIGLAAGRCCSGDLGQGTEADARETGITGCLLHHHRPATWIVFPLLPSVEYISAELSLQTWLCCISRTRALASRTNRSQRSGLLVVCAACTVAIGVSDWPGNWKLEVRREPTGTTQRFFFLVLICRRTLGFKDTAEYSSSPATTSCKIYRIYLDLIHLQSTRGLPCYLSRY